MYKLIAIDMDGTLLNSEGKLSEKNKIALQRAQERGIKIVITSGRSLSALKNFIHEIGFENEDDYLIANNGGSIYKTNDYQCIYTLGLKGKDLFDVYELSKELDFKIHCYDLDLCYAVEENEHTKFEREHIGTDIRLVEFNKVISDDDDIIKILLFADEDKIDEKIKKIPNSFREKYHFVKSLPNLLEVMNKKCNKGSGIKALADILNVKKEEIIAIGDQANDIEMIEYAGFGVAMGNAIDEIKEKAKYITDTNDNNGVAKVIEEFVLK